MMPTVSPREERHPNLDELYSVRADGSRQAIHPADVRGRYQIRKAVLWWTLILVYLVLPWLRIGGRPAFLLDIPRRHFYLFGSTFTAQDFWLAFFWLTGIGFVLVVVSALFGRIWCGYGCPHTVFLEGVFRTLERWIEGGPKQRKELDREQWGPRKIGKRLLKWGLFLGISLCLSHTALSYFMPVEQVFAAMIRPPAENWTAFLFIVGLTIVIFVNFTWFREQLCIVICPYGRLQSVLYDSHTVVVGYDRARGEPRGKKSAAAAGDCVDCLRCIAVCPTGIDIRNGTQLECVGCANCIDACDEVMGKLGRAKGLVRYDSEAGLRGERRRFLRPRLALYAVLLVAGLGVFAMAASTRSSFEAKLLRGAGMPFVLENDLVTNVFSLHVENKLPAPALFALRATGPASAEVTLALTQIEIGGLADAKIPLIVRQPRPDFSPGQPVQLTVRSGATERRIEVTLLGPQH